MDRLLTIDISKGENFMERRKFISPAVALGAIAMALASCGKDPSSSSPSSSTPEDSTGDSVTTTTETDVDPSTLPVASGAQQFVDSSYAERTKILGQIEKYAVDHALTGLPLYSDSGYQMINPRIVKGVNTYITGYGFSTLRDGYINGKLAGETNEKFQNYYHNWSASDPGSIDAWNTEGSEISDLHANVASTYYGNRLNEDKTGYEWYPILATQEHMWPVEGGTVNKTPTAEELHTTWRMHVRTGESGNVTYRTASTLADRKAFDGRKVVLEDYITTFKYMLNGANKLFRGTEMAKKTGKGAIAGVANYYSKTAGAGVVGLNETADFSGVGIKAGTDADGDYLEFTYQTPVNRFYAMYSCNSDLYAPLPAEFIKLVGTNLGNYSSDKSTSPVDNILSTGPFMLETWETDKLITFARNDEWYERKENANLYRIGGIHTDILTGYATDKNIAFMQYLNNKLDAAGVPSDYLTQYSTHKDAVAIPGTGTWKLNLNTCTPTLWESLFGENGTITRTQKDEYWNVKPWMSNENFVRGLFYSIDRQNFATSMGGTPCIDYFSDIYLSNPETGESYNSTKEHKAALENFWGSTVETYGYSASLAQAAFSAALDELLAAGSITTATTEMKLEIVWMYQNQIKSEGSLIAGYMTKAFDAAAEAKGLPVRLKVEQSAVTIWNHVYYNHLMVGKFDLAFGSISGNPLDPLNFMEVLKSDNSSGFTLNWGSDTSIVDDTEEALVYDGKRWSFDGLWDAADHGVVLDEEGQPLEPVAITTTSITEAASSIAVQGNIEVTNFDGLEVDIAAIFGTTSAEYVDYFEVYPDGSSSCQLGDGLISDVTFQETATKGKYEYSFTLKGELAANVKSVGGLPLFGVDYEQTIKGVYGGLKSSYGSFVLTK